jgi:serine/threonine protein kinase
MPTIPWEQVREVVDAVLDLPPDRRAPYLDQACPQSTVRRYVESLVLSYEQAGKFLDEPAVACYPEAIADEADSWKGRRVGPYQIIEQIGRGGMGSVYRAVRADDQYQKQVAIKVVRSGFDTRFALARFRAERQILANLDHPNIARLLEGGSTEDGLPYFVMEYIQGEPLDQYCDHHRLPITERLGLFRAVCSAVQFAHQNLVIHRDIKPSNIMVTREGVPKLLDFGIAKILGPDLAGSAAPTMTMVRLLTPEYASPEQLRGETITTASDVYSLGVVLFELLTGHRPYRLSSGQPEEVARLMAETEPEKPSAAIARVEETTESAGNPLKRTAETVSNTREGNPEKLRRRLSGDLDNIVLMALRKEPQRRYASAEQLSEDVRRHLEGLPVLARRDTVAYRTGKFVKRHATAVAAAALVMLSLAVGLAVAIREGSIARTERTRAERRFNDVRKLANSLLFDIHDAIRDLPGSTHARQLLVTNALKYLDSLAGEARGDLSLQRELADAYERVGAVQGEPYEASLGDTPGALQSYLKAQSIRKTIVTADAAAADRIKYARNLRIVGALKLVSSDAAGAVKSTQESVALTEALLKSDPTNRDALMEMAAGYSNLGVTLEESHTASGSESAVEENYRKALELDRKLAENSTDGARLHSLAVDEYQVGRHLRDAGYRTEALEAFTTSLGLFEGLRAKSDNVKTQHDVATIVVNMGDTYQMNGDAAKALASYQTGLGIMTAISSADPNNGDARAALGESNLNVGISLVKLRKLGEASKYLPRAIAIFEKATAADPRGEGINWDLTVAYVWSASITPDSKEALEDLRKALANAQRLGKVDPAATVWPESEAQVCVKMGDYLRNHAQLDAAAENYRQATGIAEPLLASPSDREEVLYALADAYFGLGQVASLRAQRASQPPDQQAANWKEAVSWYRRSEDTWRQVLHPAAVTPNGFDSGDPSEAARQLARCNAALAMLGKQHGS